MTTAEGREGEELSRPPTLQELLTRELAVHEDPKALATELITLANVGSFTQHEPVRLGWWELQNPSPGTWHAVAHDPLRGPRTLTAALIEDCRGLLMEWATERPPRPWRWLVWAPPITPISPIKLDASLNAVLRQWGPPRLIVTTGAPGVSAATEWWAREHGLTLLRPPWRKAHLDRDTAPLLMRAADPQLVVLYRPTTRDHHRKDCERLKKMALDDDRLLQVLHLEAVLDREARLNAQITWAPRE